MVSPGVRVQAALMVTQNTPKHQQGDLSECGLPDYQPRFEDHLLRQHVTSGLDLVEQRLGGPTAHLERRLPHRREP